jgi:hypothetical protein
MDDEKRPLFAPPTTDAYSSGPQPIWKENKDKKTFKLVLGGFLAFVVLNLLVSKLMNKRTHSPTMWMGFPSYLSSLAIHLALYYNYIVKYWSMSM